MSRLVKLDGETNVRVTGPVDFDFVQLTQGGNEMVSTKLGGVLDTKVVNDKCKDSAIGGVPEKAWGGCLYVPVRCEVCDEALLSEKASLWQAIHTFGDLKEDRAIDDVGSQIVCADNRGGQKSRRYAHKIGLYKGRAKVVVFDIDGHPFGVVRNNGMDQELDNRLVGGEGRRGTAIIDAVTASSATDAVGDRAKGISFLFCLWVIVGRVTSSINRLVSEEDRLDRAAGK